MSEMFPATFVADHSMLITVSGKLRGRAARQLGDRLEDLADDGVTRVILDFQSLTYMDSLGTFSLESGLDRGLQLHLVVKTGFSFDGFFTSRSLNRRGLRIHHTLEEATLAVRKLMDSGMALAC